MLNENEVIMLVLGIGIVFLISVYKSKVRRIYAWKTLLTGFYLLIAAWTFTIFEDIILRSLLNLLEHICYAVSAVIVTYWCWNASSGLKGEAGK